MVDVNPVNKNTSVNVSSSGTVSQIKTTTPQNYYDGLSKQWAISEDKVQGLDYSSKYYAQQAKENSQEALSALENVETATTNAINQIITTKNETLDGIYDISSQTQQEITELKETLKTDLENTKVNAIDEVVQNKTNALDEIETLSEETLSEIKDLGVETRANLDLSNLSEEGEKHFLGKSNITNCITKMPQTVKYEFEYGTLTIKAGTIAIFPYGTINLSSQYPKGSNFLNSSWKVVDTYYTTNKFFVWAELQTDIISTAETTSTGQQALCLRTDGGAKISIGWLTGTSGASVGTDSTGFTGQFYNTNSNIVSYIKEGAIYGTQTNMSLPILAFSSDGVQRYAKVDQAYNGIGRMGNMFWLDKGVEGLSANGRNSDGSIKNIKFVNNKFLWSTTTNKNHKNNLWLRGIDKNPNITNFYSENFHYIKNRNELPLATEKNHQAYYIEDEAIWLTNGSTGVWSINPSVVLGTNYLDANSKITNFQPKQPFRALDYNDKEEIISWGMPDYENGIICTVSFNVEQTYTAPSNGIITYSLSAYNNGQAYIKINNQQVQWAQAYSNPDFNSITGSLPVSKNDVIKYFSHYSNSGYNTQNIIFYPMKGAK